MTELNAGDFDAIECGSGWNELLAPIFDYIEKYNGEHQDEKIEVLQVKEKFGGLRFYTNFTTDELTKLIDDAEEKSYNTCEFCGKYVKEPIIVHHWIYTLCDKCYHKMVRDRDKFLKKLDFLEKYEDNQDKPREGETPAD